MNKKFSTISDFFEPPTRRLTVPHPTLCHASNYEVKKDQRHFTHYF